MSLNIKIAPKVLVYLLFFNSDVVWAGLDGSVAVMKEVVVTARKDKGKALPDVEGARIYAGKKTSVIDLGDAPLVVNNNYRQVFEKTPGLLLSEESTPLFSLGYRGLNPDRAQFMQVMKDGIPIVADLFGYPEAYYTPPTEAIDHIDFVRGGSALMFGPQPGGAINFVTKNPYPGTPFSAVTQNSIGSHDFFSHYTAAGGTRGPLGYYGYFHHRQSQGFRDFNSQYRVYYGGSKFVIEQDPAAKWVWAFDFYDEEHGEPGGLTRADFDVSSSKSTRLMDGFELNRYAGSLDYQKEFSEKNFLDWKLFGGYYERLSWRQRGGGFGALPTGANALTNDIQRQEFYTGGTDLRLRHEYDRWGFAGHQLSAGAFFYHSTSPREDKRGNQPDAITGEIRKDSERGTNYLSLFAENLFRFGKLSVTPGVRLESIWQNLKENINLDKSSVPLGDDSQFDFVPLAGVGASYEVTPKANVYGNISQAYRPKLYAEALPIGTNEVVNSDLDEGDSWQADMGIRGKPFPYLSLDASVFYMEFTSQTGTVGNTVQNVGDAEYKGLELAADLDVCRTGWNLFFNSMLLNAEFTGGPNTGRIPQYAPDYLIRAGVEYRFKEKVKVRLGGTFTDDHFGDDGNTAQRETPSYKVWDLTFEAKIHGDFASVFGGVNNLFDEHYFARVTSTGIDPADGGNYYGGVKFTW